MCLFIILAWILASLGVPLAIAFLAWCSSHILLTILLVLFFA